jgi:hypothetical protein
MRYLLGLLLCLFLIGCNQDFKSEVTSTSSVASRLPASVIAEVIDEDPVLLGFSQVTDFISEGEINEQGETWIESVRERYKKDPQLQERVRDAIEDELVDEKIRHELESIQFDHHLDLLVKKGKKP